MEVTTENMAIAPYGWVNSWMPMPGNKSESASNPNKTTIPTLISSPPNMTALNDKGTMLIRKLTPSSSINPNSIMSCK